MGNVHLNEPTTQEGPPTLQARIEDCVGIFSPPGEEPTLAMQQLLAVSISTGFVNFHDLHRVLRATCECLSLGVLDLAVQGATNVLRLLELARSAGAELEDAERLNDFVDRFEGEFAAEVEKKEEDDVMRALSWEEYHFYDKVRYATLILRGLAYARMGVEHHVAAKDDLERVLAEHAPLEGVLKFVGTVRSHLIVPVWIVPRVREPMAPSRLVQLLEPLCQTIQQRSGVEIPPDDVKIEFDRWFKISGVPWGHVAHFQYRLLTIDDIVMTVNLDEPVHLLDASRLTFETGVAARIGKGGEGAVRLGTLRMEMEILPVAAKRIFLGDTESFFATFEKAYRDKEREVRMLIGAEHPNLVKYYGSFFEINTEWKEISFVIVMKLYEQDLDRYLKKNKGRLSTLAKIDILLKIARGVRHLHSLEIIHQDLKPKNVFVKIEEIEGEEEGETELTVAVGDLGHAQLKVRYSSASILPNMRGSPEYKDPETAVRSFGGDMARADSYSFGVICWEVFAEQRPYEQLMRDYCWASAWQKFQLIHQEETPELDLDLVEDPFVRALCVDCMVERIDFKTIVDRLAEYYSTLRSLEDETMPIKPQSTRESDESLLRGRLNELLAENLELKTTVARYEEEVSLLQSRVLEERPQSPQSVSLEDSPQFQLLRGELEDAQAELLDLRALVPGSLQRILKEHRELKSDPPIGILASPLSADDLYTWQATVVGPLNSPYENAVFQLIIQFPENYSASVPKVTFTTPIFHPNVSSSGEMLLMSWSPEMTISGLLRTILSLLSEPDFAYVLSPEMLEISRSEFEQTAREWVVRHAQ